MVLLVAAMEVLALMGLDEAYDDAGYGLMSRDEALRIERRCWLGEAV